ncbi:hypothetical protein, partial [Acidithiobacillus caldus]
MQAAEWLVSLRGMLEDETTTVLTVDGGEVEVAFDALLDALENRLAGIFEMADDFDADADEAVPPPDVAYVSRRNTDPEYRKAREALRREQAEASAQTVDKSKPVVSFPIPHLDTLSLEERVPQVAINMANELYLGKKITFYPIYVPFGEDEPEFLKELITLTIIMHSPVSLDSAVDVKLKNMRVYEEDDESEHKYLLLLDIMNDVFSKFPPELQDMVRAGRFIERFDNNEWD